MKIKNLCEIYLKTVNGTLIFDNSYRKHDFIAQKIENESVSVFDSPKFNELLKFYDTER